MQNQIQISGPEWVIFGVEDLESSRRFLGLYGLTETLQEPGRSVWQALDGSGVELRALDDPQLPNAIVAGSSGRKYVWGVVDGASLERIREELSKDRSCEVVDGLLTSVDDDGHVIAFRVSERSSYEAQDKVINVTGFANRRPVNQRVSFKEAGRARAMGHLVYWSRDPERSFAFYRDRLGFCITDSFENNGGIFARATGHGDHHSIFFLQIGHAPFAPSLQHIEFQFGDVQEVFVVGERLQKAGFQTAFGPGRHELGSNWYWYFNTPLGTAFEVAADMDQADDGWRPGVWPSAKEVQGWSLSFGAPGPGG